MIHEMKLNNKPFESIKNKQKTIELRLNDEKRQRINIGDCIEFTNILTMDKLMVKVKNLHKYKTFEELYNHFNKEKFGYTSEECAKPSDMEEYYTKEEQKKYGVVGIEIELI